VSIKWGKQKFEGVELDTSAPVEIFKAQLYTLTQVPPERQKIMGVKGGTVKDDAKWTDLGVKQGQVLMLMGSAEKLAEPPQVATVFAEDMPAQDLAAATTNLPGGLANLGNTCYLNSSLQVMRNIPELSTSLQRYMNAANTNQDALVFAMRDILSELDRSNASKEVVPVKFVNSFRTSYPLFAQRTDDGRGYVQQDAEECWSTIVNDMSNHLRVSHDAGPSNLASSAPVLENMDALKDNVGDALFGIEMESVITNAESDAEPAETVREAVRKLSCHISEKTAHLYNAIEGSLEETIEKHSAVLGREAQYKKASKIARLPPYLAVQFVRFAWRKDTNKRAKILRPVSFPEVLDVHNLCSDKLRASIAAHRDKLEEAKDAELKAQKDGNAPAADSAAAPTAMETEDAAAAPAAASPAEAAPPDVMATPSDNKTGRYELFGIITHQGRTAEGGHYVAWVKQSAKKWLVFDDETVAEVDAERIKELHGGSGDWHIAYMCLFRKMDTLSIDLGMDKDK